MQSPPSRHAHFHELKRQILHRGFSFYNHKSFVSRWRDINNTLGIFGRVSQGNAVIPFRETEDAFRHMWAAVDTAKDFVKWQTYICKDDVVGKETMAKLESAHSRGVKTELLYDCGGNITGRSRLTERLRSIGATVIRHRPFFAHLYTYLSSGMNWEHSPALRNHRKILVVDKKIGFAGGLNIGDDYCGKALGGNGRFRDTHCEVVGPAVEHLLETYEDTKQPREWKFSLARWRHIVELAIRRRANSIKVESHKVVPQSVFDRGERIFGKLRANAEFAAEEYRKCTGTDSKVAKQRLRQKSLRWIRQQADAARLAAVKSSSTSATAAPRLKKEAMQARFDMWKRAAAEAFERRAEKLRTKALTKELLESQILDTQPVPESVGIHDTLPEQTQILMSNPHTRDWSIQLALWHVTRKAHRRVWITTPYYMPHRKLTRAIILAARRGVDIRIMAGSRVTTDPWFMWYASQYLTGRFLREGVKIYEFNGDQIMHAKTVVVDSVWSCIGSYNWDSMSNKNMEVCVTHFGYSVAREMEGHFLKDISLGVELTLDRFEKRPLQQRVVSFFAYHALRFMEKITFLTYRDGDLTSRLD